MDFSKARSCRLIKDDSLNNKQRPWQARLLWPALLRCTDDEGVIDVGEYGPAEGVHLLLGIPKDFAIPAMKALMDDKTLVYSDGVLRFPNYRRANAPLATLTADARDSKEMARGAMVTALQSIHPSFTGWPLDLALHRFNEGRADPQCGTCEPDEAAKCLTGAIEDAKDDKLHCQVLRIFDRQCWAETQRRYLGRSPEQDTSITTQGVDNVCRAYNAARESLGMQREPVNRAMTAAVRRTANEGYVVQDFYDAISYAKRAAQQNTDLRQWFAWPTLFGKGFATTLSRARGAEDSRKQRSKARQAPKVDSRPEPDWSPHQDGAPEKQDNELSRAVAGLVESKRVER